MPLEVEKDRDGRLGRHDKLERLARPARPNAEFRPCEAPEAHSKPSAVRTAGAGTNSGPAPDGLRLVPPLGTPSELEIAETCEGDPRKAVLQHACEGKLVGTSCAEARGKPFSDCEDPAGAPNGTDSLNDALEPTAGMDFEKAGVLSARLVPVTRLGRVPE
mmetsp:Transcript_47852/g.126668  ORF Transcript_47852/g.126668 Transcript_47852/m.126668 type:complete len:161 (+) Transcript_47852:732-1214(+)